MTDEYGSDDKMPYLLVEVTVAAAFVGTDDRVVGNNVVDATLQFGWRADNLPAVIDDSRTLEALRRQMGPVLAVIRLTMTGNKWAYFGDVADPILSRGVVTGMTRTDEVRVMVPMPDVGEARA